MRIFLDFFSDIWRARLVFMQFVGQHVTLRYRRTALGFLWTLVNPLFTMIITSVVFGMMMRVPVKDFAVFLFAGIIPWTLFSNCVLQGGGSILENEALIKKIYIPKQLLVIAKCSSLLVEAVLSFTALFILAVAIGAKVSSALLFLPVAFLLVFVFSTGLSLLMSVSSVYFRDSAHVAGIGLQAGYYLTPIIYPVALVPERYRWIFDVNPMVCFVQLFRSPIYDGVLPSLQIICTAMLLAVGVFLSGVMTFKKFESELIFRL